MSCFGSLTRYAHFDAWRRAVQEFGAAFGAIFNQPRSGYTFCVHRQDVMIIRFWRRNRRCDEDTPRAQIHRGRVDGHACGTSELGNLAGHPRRVTVGVSREKP